MEQGVDPGSKTFVQWYGPPLMEAANLLIPRFGFLPHAGFARDGDTGQNATRAHANGLLYRHRGLDDGIPYGQATFAACTFWLAEMSALTGRKAEAMTVFEE